MDPSGRSDDLHLFTPDSDAGPELVISTYADRWAIEETHRNCKQFLGAEDPGTRRNIDVSMAHFFTWFDAGCALQSLAV